MKLAKSIVARRRKRSHGFTLVELVVVLTIIVVLMGSGFFLISGMIDDAKITAAQRQIGNIETHILGFSQGTYGKPPTQDQGLRALVEKPSAPPVPKQWRKRMTEEELLDPWGNPFQYRNPPQKSEKKFDLWSLGEDGVESDDDVGNW